VQPCRRHEGDEPADEGFGGKGEGEPLLRRVLVLAVVEAGEAALGHRATGAVAGEPLEPLPVVGVHRGVGVQREALLHRHAPLMSRPWRRLRHAQPLVDGKLLQLLVLVFGPRGLEVRPVFLRLPQRPVQHPGDVVVRRRCQLHRAPVLPPQRLGHQQVQVRRQLEPAADPSARRRAPVAHPQRAGADRRHPG